MTNRIMLCAGAGENAIGIRTVCARMKSPHRFYIGYDEFDRLRRDGWAISSDIHSFVKLRLDQTRDRIVFLFIWLAGHMKRRHQEEISRLPPGFAFNDRQFGGMMHGWGLDPDKSCVLSASSPCR